METACEIRDPVHGFIELTDWERDIVNHPVFQRLRRIRQLGLTDMVYPGATHTRFEHSLGVMHIATRMFDRITDKYRPQLHLEMGFGDDGLSRDRTIVRLAALLHDVGHAPFSHSGESEALMGRGADGKRFKHEDYSAAAVRYSLRDVIEDHRGNRDYDIKAEDVAALLEGNPQSRRRLFWRPLISGNVDSDRADYLLRDSAHIGVTYGKYDLDRLLVTLCVCPSPENDELVIGVDHGGLHAAEGLILARYMMFTQVYFHHARRAYDYHAAQLVKELLGPNGFPPPDEASIGAYLKWDDWRVLGLVSSGQGGAHGQIIIGRQHHRRVYETSEVPGQTELEQFGRLQEALQQNEVVTDSAASSWYKPDKDDVLVWREDNGSVRSLAQLSSVVNGLSPVNQLRLYVPVRHRGTAQSTVRTLRDQESEAG